MKVHVIDGTYELFRAHFGAPSALNANGMEVGAARGLLRSLLSLLRQEDVSHVGIAFDHIIESFRNDLFDGYKTGEGLEPVLHAQFGLAERVAGALGIVVWPMETFEADDALATAATQYAQDARVTQIAVCSPDKDLTQCVDGDRIVCIDRMRNKTLNEDGVVEKFGVCPKSIPDYLGLVGDVADGIPGLARWGAKSTSTVLAHYKHLEHIPDDETQWPFKVRGARALGTTLREHRADAILYRTLATLRTDVPITESLEDLEWQGAKRSALETVCDDLNESNIIPRIWRWRTDSP